MMLNLKLLAMAAACAQAFLAPVPRPARGTPRLAAGVGARRGGVLRHGRNVLFRFFAQLHCQRWDGLRDAEGMEEVRG